VAERAHERYQQALTAPTMPLDKNTLVYASKGSLLAGTWTADQESVQNLLPRLQAILPE
jgi:hypothetical protein